MSEPTFTPWTWKRIAKLWERGVNRFHVRSPEQESVLIVAAIADGAWTIRVAPDGEILHTAGCAWTLCNILNAMQAEEVSNDEEEGSEVQG